MTEQTIEYDFINDDGEWATNVVTIYVDENENEDTQ